MIGKVLLLAFLAIGASASPLTTKTGSVDFGVAISNYFQAWKQMSPCGYAAENIPAFGPFTVDFLPFNYENGATNIKGNLSNIRISGLSNFEVLSGTYDADTQHATYDIIYPEVQVLGSYEIEGTVSIAGFPVPVRQSVLINKKISDWRFVGDYTFAESLTNPNGIRISHYNINYYIGDVQASFWDKFMDIAGNNFANNLISSMTMLFSQEIQPAVTPLYEKYLLPMVNKPLADMTMTQVVDYLLIQAELWNSVDCKVKA